MKYPLQLLHITVAVVLTMVVGMLPHHHHHGDPCWVFDKCLTHQHSENCPENDAANLPFNEHSCHLQAMKVFTQVERPNEIHPQSFDLALPDEIALIPHFYYTHHRTTHLSCPLFSGKPPRHYLRGPPVC